MAGATRLTVVTVVAELGASLSYLKQVTPRATPALRWQDMRFERFQIIADHGVKSIRRARKRRRTVSSSRFATMHSTQYLPPRRAIVR